MCDRGTSICDVFCVCTFMDASGLLMFACTRLHAYVCLHACACTLMCLHACVYTLMCLHACAYTLVYTCAYTLVCMRLHAYVCLHACAYTLVYISFHEGTLSNSGPHLTVRSCKSFDSPYIYSCLECLSVFTACTNVDHSYSTSDTYLSICCRPCRFITLL